MDYLVIGSNALKYYFPDFKREPKDLDVISKTKIDSLLRVEYHENPIILEYQDGGYLTPNLLLSLKISHLFFDINWDKHLFDVLFLFNKGFKYNKVLVDRLFDYWKKIHPIRRSNLKLNKQEFFTNNINKNVDDHDNLHIKLNDPPAYKKILIGEIETSETLWDTLTFDEKCAIIFEETAVMAYERMNNVDYRIYYKYQLKQNIIKHFPMYIGLFAIEQYKLLYKPFYNFKEKLNETRTKGNQ